MNYYPSFLKSDSSIFHPTKKEIICCLVVSTCFFSMSNSIRDDFFGPWDETTGRSKEVMVTPPWFWTVLLIPCRRMRHDAPVSPKCFWSMNNWGNWQWGEDTWFRPC